MAVYSFEDLIVWQRSSELAVDIYRSFAGSRDFGFKDQIQRATISISNNIAEGFARRSDKAFKNFLYIAKGSASEVMSMLLLAPKLNLIPEDEQHILLEKTEETIKMLHAFIKKLPS